MANRKDTNASFGRALPVFLILLLLGIFMSLYFFKYVPDQQAAFNDRAFQELGQIQKAIQGRDQGYRWAIGTFLAHRHEQNPLIQYFNFYPQQPPDGETNKRTIGQTTLRKDGSGLSWQITYPLLPAITDANNHPDPQPGSQQSPQSDTMGIRLDTVLTPIINTYQDIFENYLLIRDTHLDSSFHSADSKHDRLHQGEIVYNSGNLAVDYLVNTDSLLKKNDGFSLLDLHDVSIEGNAYKLFLYPFRLGKERIILAGLIGLNHYTESYKDIPFNYVAIISTLVLILLIVLPILKIYILGPFERITDWNIRMIIGTYFVAAFVAFFLFSRMFLIQMQSVNNRINLNSLSWQIETGFRSELDSICTQLDQWDEIYADSIAPNPHLLKIMRSDSLVESISDSNHVDDLMRPNTYPFPDNAFWIDSAGAWTAGWSTKKIYGKTLLLQVADRQYFQDLRQGKYLQIANGHGIDYFTMQPTLSKLDGEYTITIVKPFKPSRELPPGPVPRPLMVGLGTKMSSVMSTLLPAGYNFSIIDEDGNILYDGKPGRALLSNILQETDDPSGLRGAARFRSRRYFPGFTLKGQQVALLARPLRGFPYTLLTYYKQANSDDSQTHLILLSAFFTACILALLILSTMVNEWSMKKPSLLQGQGAEESFGWLQPVEGNNRYYLYLILGMFLLLGTYLATWFVVENLPADLEFSLFYLSLLFPFYIAIFYFRIKEKKKSDPVLIFLVTVIILIQIIALPQSDYWPSLLLILIPPQAIFVMLILTCYSWYMRKMGSPEGPGLQMLKTGTQFLEQAAVGLRRRTGIQPSKTENWLRNYSLAILVGVFMIIIIPACGIFWLFLKQETTLQANGSRLNTGLAIGQRNLAINEKMSAYKFFHLDRDSSWTPFRRAVHHLKFHEGVYLVQEKILDTPVLPDLAPDRSTAPEYDAMHRCFFPGDSTELAWSDIPYRAGDSSWQLAYQAGNLKNPDPEYFRHGNRILEDSNQNDRIDTQSIKLLSGPHDAQSSSELMMDYSLHNGATYLLLYFGSQALGLCLIYWLTISLARRVFLLKLLGQQECQAPKKEEMTGLLRIYAPELKLYPSKPAPPDGKPGSPDIWAIGAEERGFDPGLLSSEEKILCRRWELDLFYLAIWERLSPMEKFVLCDFALDGFSNYRTADTLYHLYNKGYLLVENKRLIFMTLSFKEWVLQHCDDSDIYTLLKKAGIKKPWQDFKLPLMILLAAFGLFLFFTQDALYQKIGGLIASFGSIANLLIPLFAKGIGKQPAGDK
jgi:hypothetical protein